MEQYINRIINADCLDILKQLPDKCVDLVLTDPPYGINIVQQILKKDPFKKHGYNTWENKDWDRFIVNKEYFNEIIRVSKNQIIWGGNYFADLLPKSQCWFVWNKMQRNFSLADGELAWTSFDKAVRIFDYSRGQALQDGKIHPTQKPLKLIEWCLLKGSKENDLVLDCFSGSGTTAVACHNLKRRFICIEKDPDYWRSSCERLEQAQRQQMLF